MNAIINAMKKTIMTTVREVATARSISDVDGLVADVLAKLELGKEKVAKEKSVKTESVKSEGGKKRVVSKKMKENFLKLDGATEEKLNEIIKEYKEAAEVTSFDAFSREKLGLAVEEKPKKEVKEKKPKKEKSGRFDKWTPTSTKLFKTIVEESGGTVSDELKKELVAYIEALSDEDYASSSIQGHMRAFVTTKFVKEEKKEKADEEDDEDLEEITFEGETLSVGVKSGKIYRTVDEVDTLVGYAGKGRFKNVKKPE